MGKVIQLPSTPRSWSERERALFARILRFYNRTNLANNYVETEEGVTDEGEPWVSFICHDGTTILSLTKTHINRSSKFIVYYRSKFYEFDGLDSFAADFIAENLWAESGANS